MIEENKRTCAPLKLWVILPALAAAVLLAAVVCLLHWENAISLRGEAGVSEYAMVNAEEENYLLILHEPWEKNGIMHISGALLRPGRDVGGVNTRVALMREEEQDLLLLNTQMVRRQDYAVQYDADDHCGFYAAAETKRLPQGSFQLALADETDGEKRLIQTGMTVTVGEDALAFAYAAEPESEAQHD